MSECEHGHCVTCADEAVVMTVQKIDAVRGLALCVEEDGAQQTVETALVEPVDVGARLLVHAGVALVTA